MSSAIIVGGGIAGCSTAYLLAQRGVAVTIIEQNQDIALEASGNRLAMLYPKLSTATTMQSTLADASFNFTLRLLKQLPNHADFFKACGLIQLAHNAAEKLKQNAALNTSQLLSNQLDLHYLSSSQATEIAGIKLKTSGLFLPNAGWVNPRLLCAALTTQAATDPLIKLLTSQQVHSINHTQDGWCVSFADGQLTANYVVLCNANAIKQFGFCQSARITPVRGQVNFFAANATSQALKTILCSDHFISPAADGYHTFGTSYAANDMNANICAQDTAKNLAALRAVSPDIFAEIDVKKIQGRVAWRSQTLDYMPLAGQLLDEEALRKNTPRYNAKSASLPWLNGLYVNAGHGSKGMITAPICAEVIASLIAKTDLPVHPTLASRLNPSRFLLRELGLKQLAASL